MVSLVEQWESIEERTRMLDSSARVGSYQFKNLKGGIEVRVRVGQFGFVKLFKDRDEAELIRVRLSVKILCTFYSAKCTTKSLK